MLGLGVRVMFWGNPGKHPSLLQGFEVLIVVSVRKCLVFERSEAA